MKIAGRLKERLFLLSKLIKGMVYGMNKLARLQYKCRRCGLIDNSTSVPDGTDALICLTVGHPLPTEWGTFRPTMVDIHNCKDGGLGVTDLIGCEFQKRS